MGDNMNVYQQRWLDVINATDDCEVLLEICTEIINDDSGQTDQLTQALAKELYEILFIPI